MTQTAVVHQEEVKSITGKGLKIENNENLEAFHIIENNFT